MGDHERPPTSGDTNGFGPRRRSTMRFVLSVGIALALVIALYIYQPGWFMTRVIPSGTSPQPTAAPTSVPTPKPSPTPADPSLGGHHTVDGIKITLESVEFTGGNSQRQANIGDTFAVVMLRVENLQSQDYGLVPNINCAVHFNCNFYVQDSQGEKNPPIAFDPYHTALRPVVLQPGGHQVGSYTFEVPERDAATGRLALLWYHDPLTDANNVQHWKLPRDEDRGR